MFNKFFAFTQEKSKYLWENSLFLQNVDNFILASIIAVFVSSTFASSDTIGFVALVTMFLTLVKMMTKKDENAEYHGFEIMLLIYFMIVVISLAGSSLFYLSFKGFLKTFIYIGYYFSVVQYLKNNLSKIPVILATICLCVGFEGIMGFIQSFAKPDEISTWQDISNLNPEEVMTRIYGTLKPYNPNLLGGYFVAGIPALFGFSAYSFLNKNKKISAAAIVLGLISCGALVSTGCRGAYIGLMAIFAGIFAIVAKYTWANHKKIYLSVIGAVVALSAAMVLAVSSLRARVFSIFAMRSDSSNSFRFNVYQSSWQMFQDNWLVGIGCGNQNFREIYGLYMKTGFDALSTYNVFLEIGVESGVFALVAFLAFLLAMIYKGIRFILTSADIKSVVVVVFAVISIVAVMVHGLVDTVFFRPQIQFVFWTMAALISVNLPRNTQNDV